MNRCDDPDDDPQRPRDDKVSLSELADAIRMQKGTRTLKPWWANFIGQVGVGTAFAYLFFKFITGDMATAQKTILDNTTANRAVMSQAQRNMDDFRDEDRAFKELMLIVMRQTCRNAVPLNSPTARADRDACDVIRSPR